jgi:hypothetical protein
MRHFPFRPSFPLSTGQQSFVPSGDHECKYVHGGLQAERHRSGRRRRAEVGGRHIGQTVSNFETSGKAVVTHRDLNRGEPDFFYASMPIYELRGSTN